MSKAVKVICTFFIAAFLVLHLAGMTGDADRGNNDTPIMNPAEIVINTITVTAPNGGEQLWAGSIYDIAWTSEGNVGNVIIEYSTNNGGSWATIAQSTENNGTYNWLVPGTPSTECLVRVSEKDNDGGLADESDAVFSIDSAAPGTITLRSPNGGESWEAGSAKEIAWTTSGDINQVAIHYSTDNCATWQTVVQVTGNDGSYNWEVPATPSDLCLVRVTAADGGSDPLPSDASDAVFSILLTGLPPLEVLEPNGGEQLTVGARFPISWKPSDPRDAAVIEYSTDIGETWYYIDTVTENDGKYYWTVPDTPSDKCLVRVTERNGASDTSDEVFSIFPVTQGDITVVSPNGGESWSLGTTQTIKWTAIGVETLSLEYSTDYGTTWKTIISKIPNDGSYDWTVPDKVSGQCLMRVTSTDAGVDPAPLDVSDGPFSIVLPPEPVLRVTAPNGGEQLAVGARFSITWFATNTRDTVKIEYTINGGDTWNAIAALTGNDGEYSWTVPDTPSDTCLVRVTESDGDPLDVSDSVFSILQPPDPVMTLTAPNGGEQWQAGTEQAVTWNATGDIETVALHYSMDNGASWKEFASSTANDGKFEWTVPDAVSDLCLVRVTAADGDLDPEPSDMSDQVFSIIPAVAGALRVTSPNGGEAWEVGSTHSITWTAMGGIDTVEIEYSNDAGSTWDRVTASTINSGNYDWLVPNAVSGNCLVRVSDGAASGLPRPSDESDGFFSIIRPPNPTIRVISPNGGEELEVGSVHRIQWYGSDSRNDVQIEYSSSGGDSWTEITPSTPNDGNYDWTIPDTPSTTCLVRISESGGSAVDISDAVFSILAPPPPDLRVLSPNGGEQLDAGSEYNITWDAQGINNVVIHYSTNNGATWMYIAVVPGDNGSYTWTIPGKSSNLCLVRISGADSDDSPWDKSDAVFSINTPDAASVKVLSPNGGESWDVGYRYEIKWSSSGINGVLIEYSTDYRSSWHVIESVSADLNSFTWVVPNTPSDTCLIRISESTSGFPMDTSDAIFSITQADPPQGTQKKEKTEPDNKKKHKK